MSLIVSHFLQILSLTDVTFVLMRFMSNFKFVRGDFLSRHWLYCLRRSIIQIMFIGYYMCFQVKCWCPPECGTHIQTTGFISLAQN